MSISPLILCAFFFPHMLVVRYALMRGFIKIGRLSAIELNKLPLLIMLGEARMWPLRYS
jgi:hypothetical protein